MLFQTSPLIGHLGLLFELLKGLSPVFYKENKMEFFQEVRFEPQAEVGKGYEAYPPMTEEASEVFSKYQEAGVRLEWPEIKINILVFLFIDIIHP